jgi:hypothetical protein
MLDIEEPLLKVLQAPALCFSLEVGLLLSFFGWVNRDDSGSFAEVMHFIPLTFVKVDGVRREGGDGREVVDEED